MPCPRSSPPCDSDCVPDGDDAAVERILSLYCCPVCGGNAVCLEVDDGKAVLGCAAYRYKQFRTAVGQVWDLDANLLMDEWGDASAEVVSHADDTPWRVPLTAAGAQPGGGEE